MDRHNHYDAHIQPGLEVVPQEHTLYSQHPEVRHDSWNAKEIVLPKYPEEPHLSHASKAPEVLLISPADSPVARKRWNRRWLIIGGVIAVVVIVAAVLGGVLGSKNGSKVKDSASDPSTGSNSTTTPGAPSGTVQPPQFARQGSPLSVTAKRKIDGGVDMLLFYQDKEGEIGYARCDTTKTLQGGSCWRTNGSFASHSTDRTQLAVTNLVWETHFQVCSPFFSSAILLADR